MSSYDAYAGGGETGGSSPLEWSHTVGGSWGKFLLVFVSWGGESGGVTGVTYNGVSLTYQWGQNPSPQDAAGAWIKQYVYYLKDPPAGSHTVSVAYSGSYELYGTSISCHGVDLNDPFYATASAWDQDGVSINPVGLTGQIRVAFASTWRLLSNGPSGGTWTLRDDSNNTPSSVDTHSATDTAVNGSVSWSHAWWQNYSLGCWGCALRTGVPPAGGSWWFYSNKFKQFMDELKAGLLPPEQLRNKYREVWI